MNHPDPFPSAPSRPTAFLLALGGLILVFVTLFVAYLATTAFPGAYQVAAALGIMAASAVVFVRHLRALLGRR